MQDTEKRDTILAACCGGTVVVGLLPWFSIGPVSLNALDAGLWPALAFVGALTGAVIVIGTRVGTLILREAVARVITLFGCAVSVIATGIFLYGHGSHRTIGVGRTVWPWLALVAMGVATFFAYKQWRGARSEGTPPESDEVPGPRR